MPSTKAYRQYYSIHKDQIPLFHTPWWLDIVCGEQQWVGVVSTRSFLEKKALMPIPFKKKWGMKIIQKPPLTTYLGPWWPGIEGLSNSEKDKLAMRLWPELIKEIPKTIYFHQTFRPEISLGLPFHLNHFNLGVRYTFRLKSISDLDTIYRNFSRSIRKNILKRQTEIKIKQTNNIELLYDLISNIYVRQNIATPYKLVLLNSLYQAGKKRNCSQILIAYNERQNPIGGIIYFWDYHTVYLLASGLTEEGRKNGVFPKLVWSAIQSASKHSIQCDFCGSMMERIANKNMAFNASAQSFLGVKKWSFNFNLI